LSYALKGKLSTGLCLIIIGTEGTWPGNRAGNALKQNDLTATQIVLFAPGSNRPDVEPGPDNAQLVATIKKTDASPEGPVLIIPDKDKDRKITIRPDTAIWIARAA
jgi:hypothetical protein